MGFFSFLFGTGEYHTSNLSRIEHPLSKEIIQKLVSRYHIQTLDAHDEEVIRKAIEIRRNGDGKISLFQIDQTLAKLVQHKAITVYDRKGVVKIFTDYYLTHFSETN